MTMTLLFFKGRFKLRKQKQKKKKTFTDEAGHKTPKKIPQKDENVTLNKNNNNDKNINSNNMKRKKN